MDITPGDWLIGDLEGLVRIPTAIYRVPWPRRRPL
jgi:regulator of RNase E activity RraA